MQKTQFQRRLALLLFQESIHKNLVHTTLVTILYSVFFILRLIYVRNANCRYDSAERAYSHAQDLMEKLTKLKQTVNQASIHGEMCALRFAKSFYDEV